MWRTVWRQLLQSVVGDKPSLWPFAALSATYFAHIGFFNPYLPLWLKDMGLSLVVISVLISVQSASRVFAPYIWGWISDHTGERVKLLRIGAVVALLFTLLLWLPLSPLWLGMVLLVMFSHTSAMMPMSEAAMAHLVSHGGAFDARRYGHVRLWGSIGFLVTVFVAGAWFELDGMGQFPTLTVLSLLAVVLSVFALPDLKESSDEHHDRPAVWPVLRQRTVQWFFVASFFHVLAHIGIYVFFSLYLDALGYSKTVIGLLWAASVLVEIAWFIWQSRWLHWLPMSGWLVLCSVAMVLRMVMTSLWADVLWVLVLAQCLHALTFATHHTASVALLSHHFPGRLRGRGQALYTVIAYGLTGVLGGVVGGFMSERWGLASVFQASVLTALVAALSGWRVWRYHHPVPDGV